MTKPKPKKSKPTNTTKKGQKKTPRMAKAKPTAARAAKPVAVDASVAAKVEAPFAAPHASARARALVLDEPDPKKAVSALQRFGVTELQRLFHDLFDGETRSTSLAFLRKALAKGLLERAGGAAPAQPAAEEKSTVARRRVTKPGERDPRLPAVGSTLERVYKGETLRVKVLEEGFSFKGTTYPSLSALAKTFTRCSTNGFLWFGLARPAKTADAEARA